MLARFGIQKLSRHTHLIPSLAHTALQNITNSQLSAYLFYIREQIPTKEKGA